VAGREWEEREREQWVAVRSESTNKQIDGVAVLGKCSYVATRPW